MLFQCCPPSSTLAQHLNSKGKILRVCWADHQVQKIRLFDQGALAMTCFDTVSSCRIRSDRQTTSPTLTTGVCEAGTKMRGASNMNIHYDVTCLLTAVWRSHSGQIVWVA